MMYQEFVQKLPVLDTFDDEWLEQWLPGFFFLLGCMSFINLMLAPIVHEKANKIVDGLTLVGVKQWVYWMHWWIVFAIGSILSSITLTFIWYVIKVGVYSSPILVYLWIQLSLLGMISFTLFIASFPITEDTSGMVGFLLALTISVIAIPFIAADVPDFAFSFMILLSPLFGVMQGAAIFAKYGPFGLAEGVTYDTLDEPLPAMLVMYTGQIISLLLWTKYGVFRNGKQEKHTWNQELTVDENSDTGTERNAVPVTGDLVVRIQGLGKVFKTAAKSIRAVDGIDMNIYRNEVYGFLGHNGSGKTTTINMLSGQYPPSFGDILYHFDDGIKAISSEKDVAEIQSRIGLCPQENILFDELTCREHLTLFAKLKGNIPKGTNISYEDAIKIEVEQRMKDVKLTSPEDESKPVSKFSGGMKRKVSIAIAMIGSPDLLILDEATAGMDPYSRRLVWEMIAEAKRGRSILLTTHLMDEADILSDRISILNKGKIVARGTSLELKHKFGVGYHLQFEFDGNDSTQLYEEIEKLVPGSSFDYRQGSTHFFRLAYEEKEFPRLLTWLETVGASGVTLHLSTLEEVFMKTGAENSGLEDESGDEGKYSRESNNNPIASEFWKKSYTDPGNWTRIWAFTMAETRTSMRDIAYLIFNVFLPLLFLVIGFVAGKLVPPPDVDEGDVFDQTIKLGVERITEAINDPVVYGIPFEFNVSGFTQSGSDPNFQSLSIEYAGGLSNHSSNLDLLGFHSTANPVLPALHSFVANSVIKNITGNDDSNIEPSLTTLFIGEFVVTSEGINIANLFVPLFTNLGLLPLSYALLGIVALQQDGLESNFRVMGVRKWQIYLGVVVHRYLFFFVPVFTISVFLGLVLQSPVMGSGGRWLAFILLLFSYGYSLVPFALMMRPIFYTKKLAEELFPPFFNMASTFPYIIFFVLISIPRFFDTAQTFADGCSVIPMFAYQRGVSSLLFLSVIVDGFEGEPSIQWEIVWSSEARVWYSCVLMILTGTICWSIVYWQVKPTSVLKSSSIGKKGESVGSSPSIVEISNISKEFRIVPKKLQSSFLYRTRFLNPLYYLRRLVKSFNDPFESEYEVVKAVNRVSFDVHPSEDVVLVGPSGAGKTQLIKMLVGEQGSKTGTITSFGNAIDFDRKFRQGFMGYCPQFDALYPRLTVEEQLDMVTRVRGMGRYKYGVDTSSCVQVDMLMDVLGLKQYKSQLCKNLSGGYKRKVSLAMAILSTPDICVFDEPSTGVDPGARQEIWRVLNPQNKNEIETLPAMVLSTHDMREAEVLASEVGIMINGELITKGTVHELVEKFCTFLFVEVVTVLDSEKTEQVKSSLLKQIMDTELIDLVPGKIKLRISIRRNGKNATVSQHLGSLFKDMEQIKRISSGTIKYYSIAQMTLEQIFIALSNQKFQVDETLKESVAETSFVQ